jgi:hypothetical protein
MCIELLTIMLSIQEPGVDCIQAKQSAVDGMRVRVLKKPSAIGSLQDLPDKLRNSEKIDVCNFLAAPCSPTRFRRS